MCNVALWMRRDGVRFDWAIWLGGVRFDWAIFCLGAVTFDWDELTFVWTETLYLAAYGLADHLHHCCCCCCCCCCWRICCVTNGRHVKTSVKTSVHRSINKDAIIQLSTVDYKSIACSVEYLLVLVLVLVPDAVVVIWRDESKSFQIRLKRDFRIVFFQ